MWTTGIPTIQKVSTLIVDANLDMGSYDLLVEDVNMTGTLAVNHIAEKTAGHGVTVDNNLNTKAGVINLVLAASDTPFILGGNGINREFYGFTCPLPITYTSFKMWLKGTAVNPPGNFTFCIVTKATMAVRKTIATIACNTLTTSEVLTDSTLTSELVLPTEAIGVMYTGETTGGTQAIYAGNQGAPLAAVENPIASGHGHVAAAPFTSDEAFYGCGTLVGTTGGAP